MADFRIGRLKFKWRGDWSVSTSYLIDDIVKYGANTYVCVENHSSQSSIEGFYTDILKWNLHSESLFFKGDWATNVFYKQNDVVKWGANQWRCTTYHTSTSGATDFDSTKFEKILEGLQFEDSWSNSGLYQEGDIVTYGGYSYIAIRQNQNTIPYGNTSDWELLSTGFKAMGEYDGSVAYRVGDVVTYGGYSYVAIRDNQASAPINSADWTLLNKGFDWKGNWDTNIVYKLGDVVSYASSSYISVDSNHSAVVPGTDATKWELLAQGDANNVMTTHGDMIFRDATDVTRLPAGPQGSNLKSNGANADLSWGHLPDKTIYVSTQGNDNNSGQSVNDALRTIRAACLQAQAGAQSGTYTPTDATYNETTGDLILEIGGHSLAIGDRVGIADNSITFTCTQDSNATNHSYPRTGTDPASGTYRTITSKTATSITVNVGVAAPANRYPHTFVSATTNAVTTYTNATDGISIVVDSGTYEELLPITIPAGVKLHGAGIRTTNVKPQAGLSADGVTPNNETTMFYVNNACTVTGFSFSGMTGFTPSGSEPENLELATIKGVFFAFDPNGAITTKSPYIKDCSCFSEGGVGAFMDGQVHNTGNKSMVFHAFTNLNSNGVGFWVRYGAKSEIVSCFTYYCHVGYSTTTGGKIRALNGNNSYGTYGVVSDGYDPNENTVNGNVEGEMIEYADDGVHQAYFANGETITGGTSNATATIVYGVQSKLRYIIKNISGTFQSNEIITGATSGSQATTQTLANGPVFGQKGFIMSFDGFPEEPRPGGSISFVTTQGGTGTDAFTYIIGSVAEWNSTAGSAIITVNQEKLTSAVDGQGAQIRYLYSNSRLTGHDFLSIGTGGITTTNYPGDPLQDPSQGNEVTENYPGRVYYVSTDQDGNFRVGNYFKIDQATGRATLNADAFDLSGLTELRLGAIGAQLGESINEFSADQYLAGDSNAAVPTEQAIVGHLTRGYSGTGAWRLPAGTTAQRPNPAVAGMMRYNTTIGVHEQYNGAFWVPIDTPPSISSVSPTSVDPNVAKTLTIVGDRFDANATVSIGGSLIQASDTTFVNQQQIQVNTGSGTNLASQTASGVVDLSVTSGTGLTVTKQGAIDINYTPVWSTAADLGTIDENSSASDVLTAVDGNGESGTLTYSLITDSQNVFTANGGSITLDAATGALGGTWPTVTSDTVYSFTIRVSDDAADPNTVDRTFSKTVRNNTAPTISSPTPNQVFGDYGSTTTPINAPVSITSSATDNEGHNLTWSVQEDTTSAFSNGLSLNTTSGAITGTIQGSWLNRAYARTAPVKLRVTDDAPDPEYSEVDITINFTTNWRYRTIINRGYMMGGYRSSVPWRNVNKTVHSTDTTTNLGDIMTYNAAYHDGGFNDNYGYSFGVDNSYPGTSTTGQSFNMTNDTSRGSSGSWSMNWSRNDLGCINDDVNNFSYMTGGNSSGTDRFNHTTDSRDTTIGDSGLGSDYVGAADGGDRGYVWNGTHRKLTYSNASWSGMFGTRGTHSKGLTSKYGYYYIGPPNNTEDMYKVNSTNDTGLGTIGQYPHVDSQGEHNFEMGQDVGYSIGMWQGNAGQANDSWKLNYSNDSFNSGNSGHSTLQPKGHAGCSSGACYSTGI